MNLMLHIGSGRRCRQRWADAGADPSKRFDASCWPTRPSAPSSTMIVGEDCRTTTEKDIVERDDFWATEQQAAQLCAAHQDVLKAPRPRCRGGADNVLFEGGAGGPSAQAHASATCTPCCACPPACFMRRASGQRDLLRQRSRPRDGVDAQAVDLRPAHQQHFTLKTNPLKRGSGRVRGVVQPRQSASAANSVGGPRTPEGRWRGGLQIRRAGGARRRRAWTSSGSGRSRWPTTDNLPRRR